MANHRRLEGETFSCAREEAGLALLEALGVKYHPAAARRYAQWVLEGAWDAIGKEKTRRVLEFGIRNARILAEIILE